MNTNTKKTKLELVAFHGDPQLKADILEELALHRERDQIIKGVYGNEAAGKFRGCAVGCSIHSLNLKRGKRYKAGDHLAYEQGFGIPVELAYLEDRIFENLPEPLYLAWPERFMRAVRPGADLGLVKARFLYWLLVDEKDGVVRFAGNQGARVAIEEVGKLYARVIRGEEVVVSEWRYAAAAADAAYAAADAAYAAAAAAHAAISEYWVKISNKLIEFLEAA